MGYSLFYSPLAQLLYSTKWIWIFLFLKYYTLLKSQTLVHLNTDDAFYEALLGIGSLFMYKWVFMMEYACAPS